MWLYLDIVFSLLTIFGEGWLYCGIIFSLLTIFGRGDYIVALYFHSQQFLGRGWLYHDVIFSLPTIFGEGVIISWRYIFTPDNIWGGVIISWRYIFTPENNWGGGDYIVALYFHSRQYLERGWLYRDVIFSLPTIFGEGVIISWHYIFTPDDIWWGGGWLYRDIIFSLPTIFGEGVIISWHYIFTPLESGTGGDYIWISSLPTFDSGGGRRYQAVLLYIYSYSSHRTYT